MSPNAALSSARMFASAATGASLALVAHDVAEAHADFDGSDFMLGAIFLSVVLVGWMLAEMQAGNRRDLREARDLMLGAQPTAEAVAGHICRRLSEARPDAEVVNLRG